MWGGLGCADVGARQMWEKKDCGVGCAVLQRKVQGDDNQEPTTMVMHLLVADNVAAVVEQC